MMVIIFFAAFIWYNEPFNKRERCFQNYAEEQCEGEVISITETFKYNTQNAPSPREPFVIMECKIYDNNLKKHRVYSENLVGINEICPL